MYLHIFHSGGPRPHTVHLWKVPADTAKRNEGKQVAAVQAAATRAPQTATRQMMRDFYAKYAATELPTAVLRTMWDDLNRHLQRERDARQEDVDNRVLQWMASHGVSDEQFFWDARELNGAEGGKFDAF